MPARDDHLAVARHNEELFSRLIEDYQDTYADWAVTVLFYAAVHYGRALLAHHGCPTITSHGTFGAEFHQLTQNRRLYGMYRWLKDESEHAVFEGTYYYDLAPRDIQAERPDLFPDGRTVYRVKDRLLRRLRRDQKLRDFWPAAQG